MLIKLYILVSWLKNFIKQTFYYYKIKNNHKFKSLRKEENDWSRKTVFILGGSWESSKLTKKQWFHIKKNASIGINQWFVHKFQPTFLSVENTNKYSLPVQQYFSEQLRRYCKSTKTKILIKDLEFSFFDYKILHSFRSKIFLIRKNYVPGASKKYLDIAFKYFPQFSTVNYKGFYLSCRASLITAISVACFLGAKKIVLVGFGSLSNKYFWEAKSFKIKKGMMHPINLNQSLVQTTFSKNSFPLFYFIQIGIDGDIDKELVVALFK